MDECKPLVAGEGASAECGAAGSAWWLVGAGCQLDKPGVAVTCIGPAVPARLHNTKRGVGGRGLHSCHFMFLNI